MLMFILILMLILIRILTFSFQTGTWELNKTENKFCWSDTASFVPNSPGDIVRKKNLDAVSFFGPEQLYRQHSLTSPTNPIPTPPKQQKMALTAADFGFRVGH